MSPNDTQPGPERGQETIVLLVDDDPGTARLLTLAFAEFGGEVTSRVASNGLEARDMLSNEHGKGPPPDIVVVDVDNEGFDGREVLRSIRESKLYSELPVIVFSRNDHPDVVQDCYELGATAYLVKPGDYRGLKSVVDAARTCLQSTEFLKLYGDSTDAERAVEEASTEQRDR